MGLSKNALSRQYHQERQLFPYTEQILIEDTRCNTDFFQDIPGHLPLLNNFPIRDPINNLNYLEGANFLLPGMLHGILGYPGLNGNAAVQPVLEPGQGLARPAALGADRERRYHREIQQFQGLGDNLGITNGRYAQQFGDNQAEMQLIMDAAHIEERPQAAWQLPNMPAVEAQVHHRRPYLQLPNFMQPVRQRQIQPVNNGEIIPRNNIGGRLREELGYGLDDYIPPVNLADDLRDKGPLNRSS